MKIINYFNLAPIIKSLPLLLFLGFFSLIFEVSADQPIQKNSSTTSSIRFGILPYLSTKALIKKWQPFANALKNTIGKNVILTTAPNYAKYMVRTKEYNYDFLITAPHFAVLAKQDFGYIILAGFSNRLAGYFTVLDNSYYKRIQDLRGKTITTPDPLAVITILGELTLQKNNIKPHQDITINYTPSHNNAILYVLKNRSDASISVGDLYKKFNKKYKTKLRVIAKTQEIPHVMFIANTNTNQKDINLVKKEIFNRNNSELQKAIRSIGWGTLQPVSKSDITQLQPLIPLLKDRMKK